MSEVLTAIAGSFRFKPEIDELHAEFADYGVEVIEPTRGWLYVANSHLSDANSFHPLPAERHMPDIKSIEDRFLAAIRKSNFLYLYNPDGYLGTSAAFEVGYAIACKTPIFAAEPISLGSLDHELDAWESLKTSIGVATPYEAANFAKTVRR